jgi:hypothetical protein
LLFNKVLISLCLCILHYVVQKILALVVLPTTGMED